MDATVDAVGELTLFSRHAEVTVDVGRGAISSIRATEPGTGLVEVARLVDTGLEPLSGSSGCGWTLVATGRLDGGWACCLLRIGNAGTLRHRRIVRVGPDTGVTLHDWVSNDSETGVDLIRRPVLEPASGFSWMDPGPPVESVEQTGDEVVALWARGSANTARAEYEFRQHLAPGKELSYRLVTCPAADSERRGRAPSSKIVSRAALPSIDAGSP